jgi:serine/threonine protein kinase
MPLPSANSEQITGGFAHHSEPPHLSGHNQSDPHFAHNSPGSNGSNLHIDESSDSASLSGHNINIDLLESIPEWQDASTGSIELRRPSEDSIIRRIEDVRGSLEADLPEEKANWLPYHTTVGSVLDNKYSIIHKIASGGMGVIYAAVHVTLNKKVAIKILAPETLANREYHKRFILEAKASTMLSSPHTVRVYDYNISQWGEPYLVMEFISGSTLSQVLKQERCLDPKRVITITKQIALSLMDAHNHGLVHRDLKPSNIILAQLKGHDDFAKILDFGVVKFVESEDEDLTRQGATLGTPRYMAPEQITSPKQVSYSADIYSLGLIMFAMLTGKKPFAEHTIDHLMFYRMRGGQASSIPEDLDIPKELHQLYAEMTRDDPEARPSAEEIVTRLNLLEREQLSEHNAQYVPTSFQKHIYKFTFTVLLLCLMVFTWMLWSYLPSQAPTIPPPKRPATPEDAMALLRPNTPAIDPQSTEGFRVQPTRPTPTITEPQLLPPAIDKAKPIKSKVRSKLAVKPPSIAKSNVANVTRWTHIHISTVPSRSDVYLEPQKRLLGKSPLSVKKYPHKPLMLLVRKEGYFSSKLKIPATGWKNKYRINLQEIKIELP